MWEMLSLNLLVEGNASLLLVQVLSEAGGGDGGVRADLRLMLWEPALTLRLPWPPAYTGPEEDWEELFSPSLQCLQLLCIIPSE